MNPEEKALLERVAKLAEDNNRMLRNVESRARRAAVYGFMKLIIVIAPLVIGYYYLQPYLEQAQDTLGVYQNLLGN
jgi:hypothetical protein